ncbi:MAG: hypothetical protein WB542_18205 [Polaromonas sp.]
MIQNPTLTAGETKEFYDLGNFFRLMQSIGPVTVRFYFQGRETYKAEGISLGYAEKFTTSNFDRFTVYSATAQTLQFVSRLGNEVSYDVPPTGAVTISNTGGTFTQSRQNVDAVTVVQLLATNTARRRLLVQNNTAAQTLRLTLDGSAPSATNGFRLVPGDLLDLDGYLCTDAIKAIFEAGAAAYVEYAEG